MRRFMYAMFEVADDIFSAKGFAETAARIAARVRELIRKIMAKILDFPIYRSINVKKCVI